MRAGGFHGGFNGGMRFGRGMGRGMNRGFHMGRSNGGMRRGSGQRMQVIPPRRGVHAVSRSRSRSASWGFSRSDGWNSSNGHRGWSWGQHSWGRQNWGGQGNWGQHNWGGTHFRHGWNDQQRNFRHRWRNGRWWRGRHNGRMGWWWLVGNAWYSFANATYPYPAYGGGDYGGGDYATGGGEGCCAPDGADARPNTWYRCSDPEGYYPYVRQCNGEWESVATTPGTASSTGSDASDDATAGDETGGDESGNDDEAGTGGGDANGSDADSGDDQSEDGSPGGY